jgi:hypothetical protein
MWRSPLPKGILGDPHLTHMISTSVPSTRDLLRSEGQSVRPPKLNTRSRSRNSQELTRHDSNTRKTSLSDVPPPDQDVNIFGYVWSILVLVNYNVGLDHRHLESVLHLQPCFVNFHNTRKEREIYLLCVRKLDMEMPPDTLKVVGVNELFVEIVFVTDTFTVSPSLWTYHVSWTCPLQHPELFTLSIVFVSSSLFPDCQSFRFLSSVT